MTKWDDEEHLRTFKSQGPRQDPVPPVDYGPDEFLWRTLAERQRPRMRMQGVIIGLILSAPFWVFIGALIWALT